MVEVNIKKPEEPGDGGAHRLIHIVAPKGQNAPLQHIRVANASDYRFLWVRTVFILIVENHCAARDAHSDTRKQRGNSQDVPAKNGEKTALREPSVDTLQYQATEPESALSRAREPAPQSTMNREKGSTDEHPAATKNRIERNLSMGDLWD